MTDTHETLTADVVILGGGLAGQTLARHLLLHTQKTVHLIEKRDVLPPRRQKVGESSVQIAGYYFSKVLDLDDHLYYEHLMKYNLRFYWPTAGRRNERFEDFSAGYIRNYSNIPSFQLDRNALEGELLRRNRESPRFSCDLGAADLVIDLCEEGADPHRLRYAVAGAPRSVEARWVVDASGRRRLLVKQRELQRDSAIRHGSFFWWVDGLVDIEKLTDATNKQRRLRKERRVLGHTPAWHATNHFCIEGLWFWVIPLKGKTSLGLVFDNAVLDWRDVFTVEKATAWVCEHFPLFARDLPQRTVLDFAGYKSFSHDCAQAIHPQRWAMSGEAGRFSDPFYSPGSDLISLHNTLIVDAIEAGDDELPGRCQLYDGLLRALYQAYVPTYARSYDAIGDAETHTLKYTWELAIYFGVYVFAFINDLYTDRRFVLGFLRRFARLGPWNRNMQALLSEYFQWKKTHVKPLEEPVFVDFMELGTLAMAEKTFYQVGLDATEARRVIDQQLANFEELARMIAAHVASVVLDDPAVVRSAAYVAALDVENLRFDPQEMAERWQACRHDPTPQPWSFCPSVLDRFRTGPIAGSEPSEQLEAMAAR